MINTEPPAGGLDIMSEPRCIPKIDQEEMTLSNVLNSVFLYPNITQQNHETLELQVPIYD